VVKEIRRLSWAPARGDFHIESRVTLAYNSSTMHRSLPLIVCFGDSLTAGFQSPSPANPTGRETPYGDTLQDRLGQEATVVVSGICGELTGEMVLRFSQDVLHRRPAAVVILGGTNDLGWNARPPEIMRNLITLYERAAAAAITPIPVTVPSIRVDGGESSTAAVEWITEHLERRHHLNRLILDYAQSKGLPYLDLFEATTEADGRMLAARYSNDGLHLSTEGYRLFGTLLYEHVFEPRRKSLLSASPRS
jgi:lysophospholipase L1-like esterase